MIYFYCKERADDGFPLSEGMFRICGVGMELIVEKQASGFLDDSHSPKIEGWLKQKLWHFRWFACAVGGKHTQKKTHMMME